MIVINVADTTRYPPLIGQILLGPVLHVGCPIHMPGPNMDDSAVALECDDVRAQAIVDVLRMKDKALGQYACRAYKVGPRGGYVKV